MSVCIEKFITKLGKREKNLREFGWNEEADIIRTAKEIIEDLWLWNTIDAGKKTHARTAKRTPVPASPAGATHWDECENCKTTVIPEDNYCRGCGYKLEG